LASWETLREITKKLPEIAKSVKELTEDKSFQQLIGHDSFA
jgi:hypothetical protein